MKKDGSDKIRLSDDEVTSIHVVDDRIYFSTQDSGIFSMKTDGSDRIHLSDGRLKYVMGDRLYCGLASIKLDGTEKQVYNLDDINMIYDHFIVTEDRLFFINKDDDYRLYSINLDGSDKKKLADYSYGSEFGDSTPRKFNILRDKIYFSTERGFPKSTNLDGSNGQLLCNTNQAYLIYAADDYVFSFLYDFMDVEVYTS